MNGDDLTHIVLGWEEHFEGAKSKTYNNKTTSSTPNKHGLGYRKLVREENGAALFGAWCALIQVLSRHNKPRQGYCTDTGTPHGASYHPDDLEILTGISASIFERLFKVTQSIGWVDVIKATDTTGIPREPTLSPQYPLNSDSDSDLDSDSDSDLNPKPDFWKLLSELETDPTINLAVKCVRLSNDSFKTVGTIHLQNSFKTQLDKTLWATAIRGMSSKFAGVKMEYPNRSLQNWLAGKPKQEQKKRRGITV